MLADEINLLDEYLDMYSYNSDTVLGYSDGSTSTMLLGFALNKLMSEANSMKAVTGRVYDQNDSHVFFVNYNTVNGLLSSAIY